MTIKQPVSATNDTPGKVEKVVCDCDLLWSMAHQFTYLRLSDKIAENEYSLINLFSARAKRIAATYARFYLETEDGGDPDKVGRYYWMALGAFASKTVACLLDAWQLESMYLVGAKTVPTPEPVSAFVPIALRLVIEVHDHPGSDIAIHAVRLSRLERTIVQRKAQVRDVVCVEMRRGIA